MRLGLFGGTFDPPHIGHAALARAAVKELKLDRLYVVPAGDPPLKPLRPSLSAQDRLALARLAFAGLPRTTVSPWEVERPGLSYTYMTLAAFRKRFPGAAWFLVAGGDSLENFTRWKEWRTLLDQATLVVGRRAGAAARPVPVALKARTVFLKTALPKVSATQVRALLSSGGSTAGLLNPSVLKSYVERRVLRPEDWVRARLSPKRFHHTLCVARGAEALARRNGEDPAKARLAGLLHDCAKEVPGPQLAALVEKWRLPVPYKELILRMGHLGLFHAHVSAETARRELGVKDRAVLSAVAAHTLGADEMSRLDKILYVADFSSTDRSYAAAAKVRRLARRSLDGAFREAIRLKLGHVLAAGGAVHPQTVRMWNKYRKLAAA